jgi:3-phosphoshikimate 1-carboxyvinyltransferase
VTEIEVINPGEKPWVQLTLGWFDRLKISYENKNFCSYKVVGNSRHDGIHYTVPGDFSSASFGIVAAIITNSELTLHNLDRDDLQGDKELIDVLISMGAKIHWDHKRKSLTVHRGSLSNLQGRRVDINNFIDAITILAVLACFAKEQLQLKKRVRSYKPSMMKKK